jgi:hypothetical protein
MQYMPFFCATVQCCMPALPAMVLRCHACTYHYHNAPSKRRTTHPPTNDP